MRPLAQTTFLILAASGMAWHGGGSAAQATSRNYVLETIDGHPLPAISILSGGDTTWTYWGKLALYGDGNSTRTDSTRYTYRGVTAGRARNTYHARYRIRGDTIEVGFTPGFVPGFHGEIGRISDSTLTLSGSSAPPRPFPLYLYHLTRTH